MPTCQSLSFSIKLQVQHALARNKTSLVGSGNTDWSCHINGGCFWPSPNLTSYVRVTWASIILISLTAKKRPGHACLPYPQRRKSLFGVTIWCFPDSPSPDSENRKGLNTWALGYMLCRKVRTLTYILSCDVHVISMNAICNGSDKSPSRNCDPVQECKLYKSFTSHWNCILGQILGWRKSDHILPATPPLWRWASFIKLSNLHIRLMATLLQPSSLTTDSISSRRGLRYSGYAAR